MLLNNSGQYIEFIDMILNTVFLMFVDFFEKPVSGELNDWHKKEKFHVVCTKKNSFELH